MKLKSMRTKQRSGPSLCVALLGYKEATRNTDLGDVILLYFECSAELRVRIKVMMIMKMRETGKPRWMYGVTRKDKIRNEHISRTTRLVRGSKQRETESLLNWYGHVIRRHEEHILRKAWRTDIPGEDRDDDRRQDDGRFFEDPESL